MRVALAYAGIILIWATTPLGVKWSNSTLHFTAAVGLRMSIALVVCLLIHLWLRKSVFQNKGDWKVFAAGALGIYPTMSLVYWSAQFIPSGMIAVIFGIHPFFVALISRFFCSEDVFNPQKIVAIIIALCGLGIIHIEQFNLEGNAIYGVAGVAFATFLFSISAVWLKAVGGGVEPLRQTTGIMLFSVPGFFLSWLFVGAPVPEFVDGRSIAGVTYLALAGSLLGGTLFFYVLRQCSVATTSLISLITPMLALILGMLVEGEKISSLEFVGSLLIVFSLAIYQGVIPIVVKQLRQAKV